MKVFCRKITFASALVVLALLLIFISSLSQQANAVLPKSPEFASISDVQGIVFGSPLPCYGPCIISNVSRSQVQLGESVTVMGRICPPGDNITVRIAFTRPDYSWIDRFVLSDNVTGEFSVTQTLDMAGFWNIFPIYGHFGDRLYANVTDPNANPLTPMPSPIPRTFRINSNVVALAVIAVSIAVLAAVVGTRKKTSKISSWRLVVQIAVVFLLFYGVFVDHQNLPWPAEQIAPHEFLIGANSLSMMPDGLPIPAFGCWYPCGRTLTCPLWQLQTYIYPFWNVGQGWGVTYDISGLERIGIVIGIVAVAAVLLGRFWCGWICPFGLYMDVVSRIRKAFGVRHRLFSKSFNEKFHQLSYVILAVIIIVSVIFASQLIAGTQLVPGTEQGGLVYTYFSAPFCQVCPMKPLCILVEVGLNVIHADWAFGPTRGQFWQLGQYVTSLNLFVLGLVTAAAFFFRRVWCRICPLGGLIALFNRFPPFKWVSGVRLQKAEEKCTKCGVCKRVCPTQVTEVYDKKGGDVTSSHCLLCLRCVEMCPEKDCLKFNVAGKTVCHSRNWVEKP